MNKLEKLEVKQLMIRECNDNDKFDKVKYGSIVSYPAGEDHLYQDFLVLGKNDENLTTVPILPESKIKPSLFTVVMPNKVNEYLADTYYVEPLNVAIISKKVYEQVNAVRVANLNTDEIVKVDEICGDKINTAKRAFQKWYSIEHSNVSKTKKQQALRKGFKKHSLITEPTISKYLLGEHLTGKTSNKKYHISAYFDQTYVGNIAKQETPEEHWQQFKYADVDKLRKHDIIRYRAITGNIVKWRPFLVVGQNGQSVDLVPITHTERAIGFNHENKGHIFRIYHQELSPKISQTISILSGDGRKVAAHASDNLAPCQQVSVPLSEFKDKQLPQYLGNLENYVDLPELTKMDEEKDQTIAQLTKSYINYEKEMQEHGKIKHYAAKLYARKCINIKDLQDVLDHSGSGDYRGKINFHPAEDKKYLSDKFTKAINYGRWQNRQAMDRNELMQLTSLSNKVKETSVPEMEL